MPQSGSNNKNIQNIIREFWKTSYVVWKENLLPDIDTIGQYPDIIHDTVIQQFKPDIPRVIYGDDNDQPHADICQGTKRTCKSDNNTP